MGIENKELSTSAKMQIGEYVKKTIHERGQKIEPMARACGLSKKTIYAVMNGSFDSMNSLLKVLQYLNIEFILKK